MHSRFVPASEYAAFQGKFSTSNHLNLKWTMQIDTVKFYAEKSTL